MAHHRRLALQATASMTVALLAVTGCGSGAQNSATSTDDSKADAKISVVASTDVWGSVVEAVGGDRVDVTSLIDSPDKDPHDFQSSAADTATISTARMVVLNGGGYDEFMDKAIRGTQGERKIVNAFDIAGRHGDDVNEHVFYDLRTVGKTADRIAADLSEIQPEHQAEFAASAKKFDSGIDALIAKAKTLTKGKKISAVSTESVADHLLTTAGISNVTPQAFAEAVEKETDIPASAVAQMKQLLNAKKAQLLIDNVQTETDTVTQLRDAARSCGVGVAEVSETLPEGSTDYLPWMSGELDGIAKAIDQR